MACSHIFKKKKKQKQKKNLYTVEYNVNQRVMLFKGLATDDIQNSEISL